jgi:hypothetical protein
MYSLTKSTHSAFPLNKPMMAWRHLIVQSGKTRQDCPRSSKIVGQEKEDEREPPLLAPDQLERPVDQKPEFEMKGQ